MTIFLTLLRAYWRQALGALLLLTVWYWHGERVADFRDATRKPLVEWQVTHLAADKTQEAARAAAAAQAKSENEAAMKAARERNEAIERQLNDTAREAAALKRDRDLARVLLHIAQETSSARCGAVPEAPDQSGPAAASGNGSDGSLEETVTAAIGECRRNADRYGKLIEELKPQL